MHSKILSKLNEIEQEHGIRILYAVESGSRGWGFASKDSDYDARFIYVHPTEWYLSIEEGKDFIEHPINNLLDINGWELRKALKLFKKSNPPLLEWLSSPIIYIEKYSTVQKMRELTDMFFAPIPSLYHYLHIAKNKFEEVKSTDQVKIKKYFYILRPILACMWIEKNNAMPPMEFDKLLREHSFNPELQNEIERLLTKKISGDEVDISLKNPVIMEFLKTKIEHYEQYIKSASKSCTPDIKVLDKLFRNTLKEVWE